MFEKFLKLNSQAVRTFFLKQGEKITKVFTNAFVLLLFWQISIFEIALIKHYILNRYDSTSLMVFLIIINMAAFTVLVSVILQCFFIGAKTSNYTSFKKMLRLSFAYSILANALAVFINTSVGLFPNIKTYKLITYPIFVAIWALIILFVFSKMKNLSNDKKIFAISTLYALPAIIAFLLFLSVLGE